jgi:hypothetical protein
MPIKEATFWFGITVFGTGLFGWMEGGERMPYAIALTALGFAMTVYSVIAHHKEVWPRLPVWIGLLVITWVAIGYDYYDRHHAPNNPVINSTINGKSIPIEPVTINGLYPVATQVVKVVGNNGEPLKGAKVLIVHRNGTHSTIAVSDDTGVAQAVTLGDKVSVFCALDRFSGYYQADYDPIAPLTITLQMDPNGGSIIFPDGTGYIPGLSGRLNPILDSQGRTYLYAENMAINGGKAQPVTFAINQALNLEDSYGSNFEVKIVAIIGSSSLITYRKL